MTRTYHHRGQRASRKRYEVWSKRCPRVSRWSFSRLMKRVSHRWERRAGRADIVRRLTDLMFLEAHVWE